MELLVISSASLICWTLFSQTQLERNFQQHPFLVLFRPQFRFYCCQWSFRLIQLIGRGNFLLVYLTTKNIIFTSTVNMTIFEKHLQGCPRVDDCVIFHENILLSHRSHQIAVISKPSNH